MPVPVPSVSARTPCLARNRRCSSSRTRAWAAAGQDTQANECVVGGAQGAVDTRGDGRVVDETSPTPHLLRPLTVRPMTVQWTWGLGAHSQMQIPASLSLCLP